jgi:HEAT repeat protein
MQEILIDKEQVYEGVYHAHQELDGMWVVTGYSGEEPDTEKWSVRFPPTFRLPTAEGPGRGLSESFEMTFWAIVGEKADPCRGYGYLGMSCRHADVTRVLRCSPLAHSYHGRSEPAYVGPALALSNRLWRAGATSRAVEIPALVSGVEELIRRLEDEAAPYAIARPLRTLLGRIVEASTSGTPDGPGLDRPWSQALVVLRWVASPISDLRACAGAVESHYGTEGCGAEALGWIRRAVEEATPSLVKALRQRDPQTRRRCAEALGWGPPPNNDGVRVLAASLRDSDPRVRQAAARSLGRIGPTAEAATAALIGALGDEEFMVREVSRWALEQIDPPPARAVPPLLKALEPGARVRRRDEPGEEIWVILDDKKHRERFLKAVLWVLYRSRWQGLDDEKHREKFLEAVADRRLPWAIRRAVCADLDTFEKACKDRRDAALTMIGRYGRAARAAVPSLVEALEESPYVILRVADSLARIDPEALVNALMKVLQRSEWDWRLWASEALGRLGPKAKAAIPALIVALDHESKGARAGAAQALAAIDLEASLAILLAWLAGSDVAERRRAAEALSDMGPTAEAARAALIRALEDEDVEVRRYAANSLGDAGRRAASGGSARG